MSGVLSSLYGVGMFDEQCDAVFRRPTGDESRRLYMLEGRPPHVVRLPVDDDWFEEFTLDSWEDDRPVFVVSGRVSRHES